MKKIIAITLVLVICIGNVGVANAESHTFNDITEPNNKKEIEVLATYEEPDNPTYSVTITWGAMIYKYKDSGMVWDTSEKAYRTSASGTWEPVNASGANDATSNAVQIENNSDRHVSVEVVFTPTSDVLAWNENVGGVDYGLIHQFLVYNPKDRVYFDGSQGNLSTILDETVILGEYTAGQLYRSSNGTMDITGRPRYLRSLEPMKLGVSTITIGEYNPAWEPNSMNDKYK